MSYREVSNGDTFILSFNSAFGDTGLTVTAKVFDIDGSQVGSTTSLSHVSDGLYQASFALDTTKDYLTVIYIPGGDESTATDDLKIRFLSPYGAGASAMGGGITDDEINAIVKKIKNINVWDIKLKSGRTAAQELIAKSEFEFTPKVISSLWMYKLENGKTASSELQAKSEFNAVKDIVKTTVDLSKINFNQVKDAIQIGFAQIQRSMDSFGGINSSIISLKDTMSGMNSNSMDAIEKMSVNIGEQVAKLFTNMKDVEGKFNIINTEIKKINIKDVDINVSEMRKMLKTLNDLKDDHLDILSRNTVNVFDKIGIINDNLDLIKKTFSSIDTSALNDIQKGVKKNNELLLDFDDLEKERMETLMKNIIQFLKDIMAEIKGNNQSVSELARNVSGVTSGLLLNSLKQ